jgi:hypothetical protein
MATEFYGSTMSPMSRLTFVFFLFGVLAFDQKKKTASATMESSLRRLLRNARHSAHTRSRRRRQKPNHPTEPVSVCTLTYAELTSLLERQQGRCAISGFPLSPTRTQVDSISVERLDTSRGYTIDNVSLIWLVLNSCAGWTREKFNYMMYARETWRHSSVFVHVDPQMISWTEQLRIRCQYLLRTAQTNRRSINCTLTLSHVKQQYFRQGGRCAYSGILLRLSSRVPHFQMSLERIHRDQGYHVHNICLIIRELNVGGWYGNVSASMVAEWRKHFAVVQNADFIHSLHQEHLQLYTQRVQEARQCQRCQQWCSPDVFRETRQGNHRICRSCRTARQRHIRYTCAQAGHLSTFVGSFHISHRIESLDRDPLR